ncbi:DUF2256 domain-containing protein [Pseudohongiella sp.]|uniref:DUF2256 domain-containing protein n=1 Tax=Pseudohongiella sp. TaxID=1979412 RepID=UPI00184DEB0F|nr:DUF2256 domain-containing protein [Pseudohongiella sp.]HDZ07464.1 DUF2256 domain-containing protein [Pseudohongiella sp.]HEA63031.1 DUF2256 domain-containing protein [Pseudohongiella sp.]
MTGFKGNKQNLPSKPCKACGREMTWRKAWARSWDQVLYCSDKCRGSDKSARRKSPAPPAT